MDKYEEMLNSLSEEDRLALYEIMNKRIKQEKEREEEIDRELGEKRNLEKSHVLAAVLAGVILIGGLGIAARIMRSAHDLEPTETVEVMDEDISITRHYIVQYNDNLTYLSKISGMSISDIKSYNNLSGDMIKYNQKIDLVYKINRDDIKYCTESIIVDGKSLEEIAGLYNTSTGSLYALNREAIDRVDEGTINSRFVILSDTILVPNYITPSELIDARNNKQLTK